MDTKFGVCVGCDVGENADCPLFVCRDKDGFVFVCCLVYVINNDLTILKCIDRPTDRVLICTSVMCILSLTPVL